LAKGHVRYLESRLIKLTQQAGAVSLTNDTHPDFQRLPEADRADMDTFLVNGALVLPILGCNLLKRKTRPIARTLETPGSVDSPVFSFATGAAATGLVLCQRRCLQQSERCRFGCFGKECRPSDRVEDSAGRNSYRGWRTSRLEST
jgi:hypothetical protein